MTERVPLIFAPGYTDAYYLSYKGPTTTSIGMAYISASHNRVMHTLWNAGFETHFFVPDWQQPDPNDWARSMAEYAASVSEKGNDRSIVLAGFSFGAAHMPNTALSWHGRVTLNARFSPPTMQAVAAG